MKTKIGSHEDLQVGGLFGWTADPALDVVKKYMETKRSIQIRRQTNKPKFLLFRFRRTKVQ